jgi:hypothetical protein
MNKNKKLVIMLLAAAAFIAIVVYFTGEGVDVTTPQTTGSDNFKLIKSKIDMFEQQGYNNSKYKSLKLEIASYGKSDQITADDSLGLISLLQLGKSKSLVISFDEAENNGCMNTGSIGKWTEELRKQETIIQYPEAKKRIQRYKHMVQFLAIGGYINKFKKTMYDEAKSQDYQSKISNMIGKPGVSGCPLASEKRSEWLSELNQFKQKHNYFVDYQKNPKFYTYSNPCEVLSGYNYYLNQLNCK